MSVLTRVGAAFRVLVGKAAGENPYTVLIPAGQSGRPAQWAGDQNEQVKHFKHWVYAAIRAIRDRAAAAEMRLTGLRGEEWEAIETHPFIDLMRRVNPIHTRWQLLAGTIEFLELTGNAYWYVPLNRLKIPGEIWLMPSQTMRVVASSTEFVSHYEQVVGAGRPNIRFERDEIIHFRYPNPNSLHYGWSPLQAAAGAVDAHEEMLNAQVIAFKQGVTPPKMLFSTPQVLSDDAMTRLTAALQAKYGGTDKSGAVMVAHGGLKPERFTLTPEEMDFLASKISTKKEIMGIFGVPAVMTGETDDANKSIADAMERIFARNTLQPKLSLISQQIEQDLLRWYPADLRLAFEPVLPEDREQVREDTKAAFDRGGLTVDKMREELTGRKPLGDDTRVLASSVIPIGEADAAEVVNPGD
ncbi:MAG TPA: phage portal protein [Phycisphaerae bacterium]|nr:phage portal protein [Phycisphaerae bacterium]